MAWIIKGEATKHLDATARSFADLNISNCSLQFASLAEDTLTWSAEAADATGTGTIIPDTGQIVELWWDTARKFRGNVTAVKVGMKQIQITVSGPWWWMDRVNLTSSVLPYAGADISTAATRPVYVFKADPTLNPTALLNKYIESLLARAVANGVPMTVGSVATMFPVPQMTLSEQTCASALATLMAWCPDSVAWFNYSGSVPALNITRRAVMTPVTYAIAADLVEIGSISPRMDLEVARNELHYVTRNATTGKPAWASQVSGTDPGGKLQIVTVSGPEIVDFLPRDDFESYTVQTAGTYINALAIAGLDATLKTIMTNLGLPGGIYDSLTTYVSNPNGSYSRIGVVTKFPPLTILNTSGGAVPGLAGKKMLLTVAPPDWAAKILNCVPVQITGTWLTWNNVGSYTPAETALQDGGFGRYLGWASQANNDAAGVYVSGRSFAVSGYLVDPTYTSATVMYKPWEYDFVVPPSGLAESLVAAQNWVPWEGPLTLASDECSGDNLLPHKFNLANAMAACSMMDALAKSISHNLMRGRTTIELGAPARVDFGTLVSRVRSDPKDNIVYL